MCTIIQEEKSHSCTNIRLLFPVIVSMYFSIPYLVDLKLKEKTEDVCMVYLALEVGW